MLPVPYTETTLLSDGIMDIVGNENADTSIVQTSWSLEDTVHNVEVVGDYTDLPVFHVSLPEPPTDILYIKPGKNNSLTKTCDSTSSNLFANILHAVTCCDATSAMYGKGEKR